ncbi:MAG: ECF transporter S component [Armatimonadota bacterium]|nr:ECF transporter S component [Armatimonadota bacterium]MDR7401774.1 ECF transporter S component [Armatimonadota bacterium]MDR7403076.1 ECF transporter S component [Armatimonadota bacterium]MDR7436221.1 ECF transporter S component [Armatimonadota bacterium]MDR7471398.1 ECF transporter S component [Armatimonadota bacterium]
MRTRDVAVGGMLTALALLIPFAFRGTPLQLFIPALQYSATFASHVPSMLSMLVSPVVAAMVGLGSAVGFTITLNPVIGARAFTHAVWGVLGAWLIRRGRPFWLALLAALPVHALGEGLVVWWLGPGYTAGLFVAAGTVAHHALDAAISLAVYRPLLPVLVGRPQEV